ncbi:hypothetical protein GCM10017688_65220 [Streptomyces ramulosus]
MRRALAACAIASLVIPVAATSAAAADTGRAEILGGRYSFSCSSPKGKKANYSFTDGMSSTTIYYNNHCSKRFKVRVRVGVASQCWSTPRGKGKEIFQAGVLSITKGC